MLLLNFFDGFNSKVNTSYPLETNLKQLALILVMKKLLKIQVHRQQQYSLPALTLNFIVSPKRKTAARKKKKKNLKVKLNLVRVPTELILAHHD